jgi:hypothetical protein
MGPDDIQGSRADGAGGSEDGDGPGLHARVGHSEATAAAE